MAKKRKKCAENPVSKVPGATNWNKLCVKLNKESSVSNNGKLRKVVKKRNLSKKIHVKEAILQQKVLSPDQVLQTLSPNNNLSGNVTHRLALDCEMVGSGLKGEDSQLARVSIVNVHGHTVYDEIVLPQEKITDYRSHITGLNENIILKKGRAFKEVQQEVADILKDKVVIGHDIRHDFQCLGFSHPIYLIRDTSKYKPFKAISKGNTPSLKKLCQVLLSQEIQSAAHDSVEDAKAALTLYKKHRAAWERSMKKRKQKSLKNKSTGEDNEEDD